MIPRNIVIASGWKYAECAKNYNTSSVITFNITEKAGANHTYDLCKGISNLPKNYFNCTKNG